MADSEHLVREGDQAYALINQMADNFCLLAQMLAAPPDLLLTALGVILARATYEMTPEDQQKVLDYVDSTTKQNALLMQKSNAGRAN